MEPEHWHTVLMGRWRDASEHITLKEGRALILALRRLARNQNSRNRKQILVDNMALAMTSCKGRATNYGMLRIMQQAAAISLAGNSSYRLRWVASELNVADGPSRGQIRRALTRASPAVVKSQPKNKRVLASSSKKATEVKLPNRVLTYPSQKEISKVTQNKKRKSFHPLVKEQKSAKRMLVSRSEIDPEAGTLAKKNKPTMLERRSVSQAVESQYVKHYQGYLSFCREHGLELPPASGTDANLADYMDVLYLEGQPMNQGEKILASIEYFNGTLRGSLLRSRRALRGWRKEQPLQSRAPLPKLVVYGLCMKMIAHGKRTHALKTILDFDTYMRPGESQDLMKKHLVIPAPGAGPQFRWYGVIVRDYDELRLDKVGIFDNTLLLNSVERGWLGDILHKHVKTLSRPNSKIFSFSSEDFRKTVSEMGKELGVDSIHPYQLRHGGASDDLNAKSRDYLAVKARGRWSTDQSVRRYGKVGKIQQILNQLSPSVMAYCRWSHRNLEKAFKNQVVARRV